MSGTSVKDPITIHKVKAHCEVSGNMTQFQQWCIWEVDQLAKDAIQVSHRSLYLKLQKAYVTVCRNRQDILEVYNFWAFASVKILQQEAVSAKQRRQDNAFSPEVPALSFASRVSYIYSAISVTINSWRLHGVRSFSGDYSGGLLI